MASTSESFPSASSVGQRIRRLRFDSGLSLTEVARRAGISKGYLSTIENDVASRIDGPRRPSGETLRRIADVLSVGIADLVGDETPIPPSLQKFAAQARLPLAEVHMLAAIRFRGKQPRTPEGWRFIHNAIMLGSFHQ
jgi:transcriptional regulator with XRE-family HTH domain